MQRESLPITFPAVQAASTRARKGRNHMSEAAVAVDQQMIQFVLPSIPESVRIARFHVRAALGFHRLGEYADDAEIITSELVTNTIQHVAEDPGKTIGITLARVRYPMAAVAVIVSDSSRKRPIKRQASTASGRGRGLQIVEALSVHWGWHPEPRGKAIFAVLGTQEQQAMARISALPVLHDIGAVLPT
jgi:anti-sigma regulatory factor (Ser/Thr protein kinase)